MIDLKTAKQNVESRFKEASVNAIYDFDPGLYLAIAPSSEEDYNDPFYLVKKSDGSVRFFNPLEDLDKFEAAMEKGPIKTF